MSDYCKQCNESIFGEDYGDFKGETGWVLCEGCGESIKVDLEGKRISGIWLAPHSQEWISRLRSYKNQDRAQSKAESEVKK